MNNNSLIPQYTHSTFTIARIQNGTCQTLEFEEGKKLSDFPESCITRNWSLRSGYRKTPVRMASVLSSLTFFRDIFGENPTSVDVELRKEATVVKSVGQLDPTKINLTEQVKNQDRKLSDLMSKSGSVIVLLDPDGEPSKHLLNDLAPYVDQFDRWKGLFIFVSISEKGTKSATFQTYKLPAKTFFYADSKNELGLMLSKITGKDSKNNLPVVVFCKSSGEVLMASAGYKIGMGEQLLQWIKRIEESCSPQ